MPAANGLRLRCRTDCPIETFDPCTSTEVFDYLVNFSQDIVRVTVFTAFDEGSHALFGFSIVCWFRMFYLPAVGLQIIVITFGKLFLVRSVSALLWGFALCVVTHMSRANLS